MTIQHQTWSPAICSCVIEQQFDDSTDNPQPQLLFFHKVCDKHVHLVKEKPKLKSEDLAAKKSAVIAHKEKLLRDNRIRHLRTFDEHENRKQLLETIKEISKSRDTEKYGLKLEAQFHEERRKQIKFLDEHENNSMEMMLLGIHSPYAFNAQEVYDTILDEIKHVNPIVENDG